MAGHLKRELAVAPFVEQLADGGLLDRQSAEHERGATQTPDSDLPPGVSYERRRWHRLAEVFVLTRPGHREDCEESIRRIESRVVLVRSRCRRERLWSVVQMLTSRDIAGHAGESSRRGFSGGQIGS